jgi:hypothetical protein
LTSRD